MARISKESIERINAHFCEQRQRMRFGGVVSLKSLWTITRPAELNKIRGIKATVKAKELENGHIYLYINLPLADNVYEELRLISWSDLEEEDEIDISSIIVIFFDNEKGETVLRYDAVYLDEGEFLKENDVKSLMIHRNADLLMHSNNPTPMDLEITYEGGTIQKNKFKILTGKEYTVLYEGDYFSDKWKIYKLPGYTNAIPLTHGLILAEGRYKDHYFLKKYFFDVLNAEGSIFCRNILSVDYGKNYIIAKLYDTILNYVDKLWWFNYRTNQWEEKDYPIYVPSNPNMTRERQVTISLKKLQINESLSFFVYQYSSMLEDCIVYDESTFEWEPSDDICFTGLLDENGNWRIKPQMNIETIDHLDSIIIMRKEGKITLYDSEKNSYKDGSLIEMISADDYMISNKSFFILKQEKMQGVFDANAKKLIIPFCIDESYHILPQTLGDGLIGVYSEDQEKTRYHTKKRKCYFFLDYSGNIKLTIEHGYEIDSKFHEGQAVISKTDNYHGEFHQKTIDVNGNTISEHYESFHGIQEDYYEDDMRNLDRDNWDAMTDGMYGDYPDEGYDGDYEFTGR